MYSDTDQNQTEVCVLIWKKLVRHKWHHVMFTRIYIQQNNKKLMMALLIRTMQNTQHALIAPSEPRNTQTHKRVAFLN